MKCHVFARNASHATLRSFSAQFQSDVMATNTKSTNAVRSVLDFLFSPWPSRLLREHDVSVDEVIIVKTTRGDKVIVPPNYGHVTINPSEKTLKMANWVCRSFESLYEPYTQHHGGAYYELINGRRLQHRAYDKVSAVSYTHLRA